MKVQNSTEPCSNEHCMKVKDSLIDLYINVKVRNDTSMIDISSTKLDEEREELQSLDNLDLIEYIKSSVEILVSLKMEDEREEPSRSNFL